MTIIVPHLETKLNKEIIKLAKDNGIEQAAETQEGEFSFDRLMKNKLLLIAAIRKGIPYSLFEVIKELYPFTDEEWAQFMDLSTKSLQRYRSTPNHHFRPIHSEKIMEVAEVVFEGLEDFGSLEKLKLWLNTPCFALGGVKPVSLLHDSYGKEMIMVELININHGILI